MTEPRRSANTGESQFHVIELTTGGEMHLEMRNRRPITLEEASRGDLPKPFSPEEWKAMHKASCVGGQNRT